MKQNIRAKQSLQPSRSQWVFIITFAAYLLILLYVTLFSQYFGRLSLHRSLNLIPFSTIMRYWPHRYLSFAFVNLAGNIAAFIPFGFLLPLTLRKSTGFRQTVLSVLLASLAIELVQYWMQVGVTDVDDIILNLVGGTLGWILFKVFIDFRRLFRS